MKRLKRDVPLSDFLESHRQRKSLGRCAWKRWHWLEELVKEHDLRIGAELGVKRGRNLFYLLEFCPRLHMLAVDLWQPQPKNKGPQNYLSWNLPGLYRKVVEDAKRYRPRVLIFRTWTHVAAEYVKDRSLDFVFIDADHSYEACVRDIVTWRPKVRRGGFVTGHDTHFEGVSKAIDCELPGHVRVDVDHCWYARMT